MWNQEAINQIAHKISEELLQWILNQANEGNWEKDKLAIAVCKMCSEKQIVLNINTELLQQTFHQANKQGLVSAVCKIASDNQMVPKISKELLQWTIHQAKEDSLVQEELSGAVCKKSSDQRPTLLLFAEEAQKQLAVMNKAKTCQIVPWLSSNLQEWIYEEAREGRWPQEMVSKVLKSEEKEGAQVVSAKMTPGEFNVGRNSIRFNT